MFVSSGCSPGKGAANVKVIGLSATLGGGCKAATREGIRGDASFDVADFVRLARSGVYRIFEVAPKDVLDSSGRTVDQFDVVETGGGANRVSVHFDTIS